MTEKEIYDKLQDATNLMTLVKAGSELKANGEDPCVVNKVINDIKKKLVSKVADIKKIPRINFPVKQGELMSHIPFQVQDLASPNVTVDANGVYIL